MRQQLTFLYEILTEPALKKQGRVVAALSDPVWLHFPGAAGRLWLGLGCLGWEGARSQAVPEKAIITCNLRTLLSEFGLRYDTLHIYQ